MEGSRRRMVNGGNLLPSFTSSRLIPKRGRVKVMIVVGLANSVASIFTPSRR
ncbi:hypothetical protein FNV43_RR07641 [Rhamnella rubrinervis]|uniref:Uncharacterized protein n=1 Tax=Rhamnella rubrinervis TaxID=2594499 RepID=A0A8K0HF54_9ROSA|nr:hypothetical protein FNV43_RR07641 [Rhamnella rubrinervis]